MSRTRLWQSALFCLLSMILTQSVFALEPPRRGEIERLKQTGEYAARLGQAKSLGNHRLNRDLFLRALDKVRNRGPATATSSQGLALPAPPPATRLMQTKGNIKIFAMLIDFPDYPAYNSLLTIQSALFGDGTVNGALLNPFPYESLANYYKRSSYNQLDLSSGVTVGLYHSPINRASVEQSTAGRETLIKEAIDYFRAHGQDFSQFDNDGDGRIEYFIVLWAGPNNGWANFWWGYQTSFSDAGYSVDGKTLGKYSWQWEYNYGTSYSGPYSPRVAIHETGHALGLPDYYDYDNTVPPNGGVGGLDMMDSNWGDHNSFSKWVLDWITPTVVASGSQAITLNPAGISQDAVLIMPGATASNYASEFFIVENRYRTGNDPASALTGPYDGYTTQPYPADGMLIWHVSAQLNADGSYWLYDNTSSPQKLLKLMQADGLDRIENLSYPMVDAATYYQDGGALTSVTKPSSWFNWGADSRVSINQITKSGQQMAATFAIDEQSRFATLSVAKQGSGSTESIVTSSDGTSISCGNDCVQSYAPTAANAVTLTAVPAEGARFVGWSGGCTGVESCTVVMTADIKVTANFDSTTVLNEDFDPASTSPPNGWSAITNSGPVQWSFAPAMPNTTGGNGGYALAYGSGGWHDIELRTPAMNLSGSSSVSLSFTSTIRGYTCNQTMTVDLSLNGPNGPWTQVWRTNFCNSTDPVAGVANLSSLAGGQDNVMLRFHVTGDEIWWGIDDIVITATNNPRTTTTTLTSSANPATYGQSVMFAATITPADASGTVTFMDGTVPLATVDISNSIAILSTAALTPGNHTITAVYSGCNGYSGSSSPVLTQAVYNLPDLVVTNLTGQTSSRTGITITATIANQGTAQTSSAFQMKFYLSPKGSVNTSDLFLDKLRIKSLAAGESTTVTAAAKIPTGLHGAYYIRAIIDTGNSVTELNENNNTGVGDIILR